MNNEIPNNEWELVEKVANDIRDKIYTNYLESVISNSFDYVEAEVLVPMSENINMIFKIDVPYEMMDESNEELLKYFKEEVYPSYNVENISLGMI